MKYHNLLLGSALAILCGSALAGEVQRTTKANASVSSSCKFTTLNDIDFGNYDIAGAQQTQDLHAESTMSIQCTQGSNFSVYVSGGYNHRPFSPDGAPDRRMKSGTNYLSYQVYINPERTTIWTTNTHGLDRFWHGTSASSLDPMSKTMYMTLMAGQDVPSGTYVDTMTVHLLF